MTFKDQRRFSLDEAIKDVDRIVTLFVCNQYRESLAECEKQLDRHFYFHVLKGLFKGIHGLVTFEEKFLLDGLHAIQSALDVVHSHRKRSNPFKKMFFSPNCDSYTDDQVQAEGSYSILSAMFSVLTLACEKSLIGLIKSGYWGKSAMDVLRECKRIYDNRSHWESDLSRETVQYGVSVGFGIFHLVLSMLPTRILRLVRFLGFPGDRTKGINFLLEVANSTCLWSPVAAIGICGYHCYIEFIMGLGNPDVHLVNMILSRYKERYPDSGFFLTFDATAHHISGQPRQAIMLYERATQKFEGWVEWQNSCLWLSVWCYSMEEDWHSALKVTKTLLDRCTWSPCIFMYQYAAILQMIHDDSTDEGEKLKLEQDIEHYLKMAPTLKKNVAGKTLYVEKFVTKRCQMYFQEKRKYGSSQLVLPMYELYLLWNIFLTIRDTPELSTKMIDRIDRKMGQFPLDSDIRNREVHLYLMLLRGICLKFMGRKEGAMRCLNLVMEHESTLNLYPHLAPLATLELGHLYMEMGDDEVAHDLLVKSMTGYRHYLNETMVHIRAHSAISVMEAKQASHCSDEKKNSVFINEEVLSNSTVTSPYTSCRSSFSDPTFKGPRRKSSLKASLMNWAKPGSRRRSSIL